MRGFVDADIESLVRPHQPSAAFDGLIEDLYGHFIGQMEAVARRYAMVASDHPEYHEWVEQALAAAMILRNIPSRDGKNVVLHPAFHYWLCGMRRLSVEGAEKWSEFARDLGSFVWPHAWKDATCGRRWRLKLDDRGGLRCIQFGTTIEFGPEHAGELVTIDVDAGGLTPIDSTKPEIRLSKAEIIRAQACDGEAPIRSAPHVYLASGKVEFSSRDPALRVRFTGTHQRKTGVEFFGSSDELFSRDVRTDAFEEALALLARLWPEAYSEMTEITRVIVPMHSGDHQRLAFTVSSRQGAIFLDENAPRHLVDNILHENAHVKLRHLQVFDTLLNRFEADEPRFAVPWRKDDRPLPGIFEGAFVFLHEAEWAHRLICDGHVDQRVTLVSKLDNVARALALVGDHGDLTPIGARFVASLRVWHDELSAATAQLAA